MIYFIGSEDSARLFILDDARPFGIEIPQKLITLLKQYNKIKILDASQLAEDLCILADAPGEPVSILGNGGVLVYTLLSRLDFRPEYTFIDIERLYREKNGRTEISYVLKNRPPAQSRIIDDVIAGGGTANFAIRELEIEDVEMLSLVISGNTRNTINTYRQKEGSTVKNVERVCSAISVKYNGGFPSIFSARFLLKKTKEDSAYRRYLSTYVDGRIGEIHNIVNRTETGPFDLLYREPETFIKKFGGS